MLKDFNSLTLDILVKGDRGDSLFWLTAINQEQKSGENPDFYLFTGWAIVQ